MSQKNAKRERQLRRVNMEASEEKFASDPRAASTCLGYQAHDPRCDGTCNIIDLDPATQAINEEKHNWVKAGMTTDGVIIDTFQLDVANNVIVTLLIEKGIIGQEEVDTRYKEALLDRLRTIREQNEAEVAKQRALSKVIVNGGGIQLPPGFDRQ